MTKKSEKKVTKSNGKCSEKKICQKAKTNRICMCCMNDDVMKMKYSF